MDAVRTERAGVNVERCSVAKAARWEASGKAETKPYILLSTSV